MNRATPNTDPKPTPHRFTRVLTAGIAVAALACGGLAVGGAASAAPTGVSVADLKLSAPLRDAKPTKTVAAFVRTTGQGALEVDAKAKGGDLTQSRRQSSAAADRVEAIQSTVAAVRSAVKRADADATELYSTEYTVPGVAIVADVSAFTEIAKRSDVLSIAPLLPKKVVQPERNASADAAPSGVDPDRVPAGADGVTPKNAASDLYPWLPIGMFFEHEMNAAAFLKDARIPVAIVAGERDTLIRPARTEALRRRVPNLVFDRTIRGAGHNDIYHRPEFQQSMRDALAAIATKG